MKKDDIIELVKDIAPSNVKNAFDRVITVDIFREVLGKEQADFIITSELMNQVGYPPLSESDMEEVDFVFFASTTIDSDELIGLYIDHQTTIEQNDDRETTESKIRSEMNDETSIYDFIINNFAEIHIDVNESADDFLEKHAYYDDDFLAKRLEELFEKGTPTRMVETREAMRYNPDYFIDKFYIAVSDTNLPAEEFDYDETPVKVARLEIGESFEAIAERLSQKLVNYLTVQSYVDDDEFYKDLLKHDFIYYELELDIDLEDYEEYL